MPLNGPREGSVALSSNRVCKDVPLPPRSTHASRMLSQNLLFHARHACLSTYVIPHMYRPASPPSLMLPKNIFGRGLARLRSETNCRRRNIECPSYVGKRWK